LIKNQHIVAIIEGNLESKLECPESQELINLLNENKKVYFIANSLNFDEESRAYLKETYGIQDFKSQIFIKGTYLGNNESFWKWLEENPSERPKSKEELLNERIYQIINQDKRVLFLKGTPDLPVCGFSDRVVTALNSYKKPYGHFNILEDAEVREGVKKYSNWNTYP